MKINDSLSTFSEKNIFKIIYKKSESRIFINIIIRTVLKIFKKIVMRILIFRNLNENVVSEIFIRI